MKIKIISFTSEMKLEKGEYKEYFYYESEIRKDKLYVVIYEPFYGRQIDFTFKLAEIFLLFKIFGLSYFEEFLEFLKRKKLK
jgi:hypothetical protein